MKVLVVALFSFLTLFLITPRAQAQYSTLIYASGFTLTAPGSYIGPVYDYNSRLGRSIDHGCIGINYAVNYPGTWKVQTYGHDASNATTHQHGLRAGQSLCIDNPYCSNPVTINYYPVYYYSQGGPWTTFTDYYTIPNDGRSHTLWVCLSNNTDNYEPSLNIDVNFELGAATFTHL